MNSIDIHTEFVVKHHAIDNLIIENQSLIVREKKRSESIIFIFKSIFLVLVFHSFYRS
jgi:hypothetical protein